MRSLSWILLLLVGMTGCSKRETRVESGDRLQIFHLANGTEPETLDPQVATGVPEHHVITSLVEGLVSEDPKDLHPIPGMAERWDVSDDRTVYTFHLRQGIKWTSGDAVTAEDFVRSYERILNPKLASYYSYMLFVMRNAEEYNKGTLTDFAQVGVDALDERTLRITLANPTPYFLSLLNHYTWFPVHLPTIDKHGDRYDRRNPWTRPGNHVGNGPFRLKEWRTSDVLIVERNPDYWDAATVRLNEIHFYPMDSAETQERAFRSGQLHATYSLLTSKLDAYRKSNPELLRVDPWLATYFYRFNTTREPTNNKLVRQALALSVDRKAIVDNIMRGGQTPATYMTPHYMEDYKPPVVWQEDVEKARRLLAEAGYPNGQGFPKLEILYNTDENHRAVAEAIQEMWRKNLGIQAELVNQEWKVYLDRQRALNYQVSRAGWTGDYIDPRSFLDMWTSWSQQNQTGWANAEYDRLIEEAGRTPDATGRLEIMQQAERVLLEELPVLPLYIYTRFYLIRPNVKGWYPTLLDHHPYKYIYLEAAAAN